MVTYHVRDRAPRAGPVAPDEDTTPPESIRRSRSACILLTSALVFGSLVAILAYAAEELFV